MSSSRIDEVYGRWRALRELGRPVLPEWLCGDDVELQRQLERLIDAEAVSERQRSTVPIEPIVPLRSAEEELAALLRQRLRWFSLIVIFWWMLWILIDIDDTYPYDLLDIVQNVVNFSITGLLAALLWSRLALSLKQLRGCELGLFGLLVFDSCWDHFFYLHIHWLEGIAQPGQENKLLDLYGTRMAMPWVFLMLVYAMYIPNHWRRSALVCGGMVACALAMTAPFLFGDDVISVNLTKQSLREMLIWIVPAGLLAVWGTHKMDTQRQEVRVAREYGQYRLQRELRRGGMGQLYVAEHNLLRRPCVIKIIHPDRADNQRLGQRFAREVRTLAALTHSNIVQIFDYGTTTTGTFYYVMEYLPGLDLADLVGEAGPLPAGRVVYLLRQVCSALHEAHACGLIHRDIKPHNILASERGRIFDVAKLLDFGLVHQAAHDEPVDDRLTRDGAVVGTPTYISPEQIGGGIELDGRSDLYSLGAVAYFLLTGRPPFARANRDQLLRAHLVDPVIPPSTYADGLPDDLEAIVMRCLEKDPKKRFADAASLEAALARCSVASDWSAARAAEWWRMRIVDRLDSTVESHM